MNAVEFVHVHRDELSKFGGGELAFVEMVLARVRSLDFTNVRRQVPFADDRGGRRRIDFAIVESAAVKIAIEVDGYDKTSTGTGMSRAEFDDFILRQNALTRQGWLLLRFTNAQVRHAPDECVHLIEDSLKRRRSVPDAARRRGTANPRFYWPIMAATPLLVLGFFRLPYEFYVVQKVGVSVAVLYGIFHALRVRSWGWAAWLLIVGLVYNPVAQVYLGSKSAWNLANLVTLASLWGAFACFREEESRDRGTP